MLLKTGLSFPHSVPQRPIRDLLVLLLLPWQRKARASREPCLISPSSLPIQCGRYYKKALASRRERRHEKTFTPMAFQHGMILQNVLAIGNDLIQDIVVPR
jgi:hypothetical protein